MVLGHRITMNHHHPGLGSPWLQGHPSPLPGLPITIIIGSQGYHHPGLKSRVTRVTGSGFTRVSGHRITMVIGLRITRVTGSPLTHHHESRVSGHYGLGSRVTMVTGSPWSQGNPSPGSRVTGYLSTIAPGPPWSRVTYNQGLTTGGS